MGVVKHAHPGIGFLDIQWPFGPERVSPEFVVKVNPDFAFYLPPSLDQTPRTHETQRLASWKQALTPDLWTDIAKGWHQGRGMVGVYDDLYRKAGNTVSDHDLRAAVTKMYQWGEYCGSYRIASHAVKTAAYWAAGGRQYRVTAEEVNQKKPLCPKCSSMMRKTTYKMKKGERHRLWGCRKCLFLIKTTDFVGPDGKAVDWLHGFSEVRQVNGSQAECELGFME